MVCAFFGYKTLANHLPNGKIKKGLNDNQKGLDQNIAVQEKWVVEEKWHGILEKSNMKDSTMKSWAFCNYK